MNWRDPMARPAVGTDLVAARTMAALRLALVFYLLVVVSAGYLVRTVSNVVIGSAALALAMLGQLASPSSDRATPADFLLYAGIVVAITVVSELVAADRRHTDALTVRLEGRAAAILDKVADAVVLTDEEGSIRSLNPAARRLTGAADSGHTTCAALLKLHDGERELDCSTGCALLKLDPQGAGARLWRPLPDGRRQPLLATAAQVSGGAEIVHSLRDVTKLVEADEAKTVFLAATTHELKTPLTVITGFASTLIREPDLEPELRDAALSAIHQRSQALSKMVDRLLLSSRIEAGRLALTLDSVDVTTVVEESLDAARAQSGRTVVAAVDGVPPAWGNVDAIGAITDQLVENALKFSEDSEVYVTLAKDAGRVVLTVLDHGIGMDAHQAEHCFDKFWQGEAGDARRFEGTGIGLYVVKSLVEAMHGDIAVRSELGSGSEFTVRLPVDAPVASVPPPRAPEPSMIREFMRQIGVEGGNR